LGKKDRPGEKILLPTAVKTKKGDKKNSPDAEKTISTSLLNIISLVF
jgi:hypothetical protein